MTEAFWDQGAPYGPNGYSFGRGERVEGKVSQSIQFRMRPGDQCLARGVMLMTDGRVYTWTVLREGRDRGDGRRRLATLVRTSFEETARGMFDIERDRIDPELIDCVGGYRAQVNAL
jgi:hypothetical protein